MSTVNYTEIIFKVKEEYIKHTRVNEDGSIHFTLEMPVVKQALESLKVNDLETSNLALHSITQRLQPTSKTLQISGM